MPNPLYPLHPEPMKASWLERHPLWKIPLGALTLLLLIAVFGGLVMAIVTASIRSSDVCKRALVKATQNEQMRGQMGEPLRPGWLIAGH